MIDRWNPLYWAASILIHSPFPCNTSAGGDNWGISIGTFLLYTLYNGYLRDDISSVSRVDPWIKRVSWTVPQAEIFNPASLIENAAITHQNRASAKKLGCLQYLNSPVVRNPTLYTLGGSLVAEFESWSLFCVWYYHCWSSAIFSNNKRARAAKINEWSNRIRSLYDT